MCIVYTDDEGDVQGRGPGVHAMRLPLTPGSMEIGAWGAAGLQRQAPDPDDFVPHLRLVQISGDGLANRAPAGFMHSEPTTAHVGESQRLTLKDVVFHTLVLDWHPSFFQICLQKEPWTLTGVLLPAHKCDARKPIAH